MIFQSYLLKTSLNSMEENHKIREGIVVSLNLDCKPFLLFTTISATHLVQTNTAFRKESCWRPYIRVIHKN